VPREGRTTPPSQAALRAAAKFLTQAKYHKNIEIDLLFRLGLLKFLTFEMGNQFANPHPRRQGMDSQARRAFRAAAAGARHQGTLVRAAVRAPRRAPPRGAAGSADCQRRGRNVIAKARRALFGEDFASYYELGKNRLIFLDGGKDDDFFLEHYILLATTSATPIASRPWTLSSEFLREAASR